MKLTELNPRWFKSDNGALHGFTFECPHCREVRLGVNTTVDGARLMHEHLALDFLLPENVKQFDVPPKEGHAWTMTGNDFSDITISPSINAEASGHWHGFIKNGEIS
jgi:hypothetical protein